MLNNNIFNNVVAVLKIFFFKYSFINILYKTFNYFFIYLMRNGILTMYIFFEDIFQIAPGPGVGAI